MPPLKSGGRNSAAGIPGNYAPRRAVRDFVRRIAGKDTVTLLYASKNAAGNHALILQEYLARATAAAGVTNARYS